MTARTRAALWMLGGVACFCAMAVAGRQVSPHHDPFEIMLYRSGFGLIAVTLWARATSASLRPGPLRLHALRNSAHFFGQITWFHAVAVLPLAQVFALEFTAPLWVLLLSPLLLNERITQRGALSALIGFAGVLLVAQPGTRFDPELLIAAACALGFALSAIFTRRLTRTESLLNILFWLNLMQLAFALITAGADGAIALPGTATIAPLTLIAVAGLLAHVCLTSALALAPAAEVMPVDFLRLPLIAALGLWLFDESLTLGLIAGGLMILGANWINLARR
jgi:drug/metabolite transporter (DMT)-like permease